MTSVIIKPADLLLVLVVALWYCDGKLGVMLEK